MMLYKVIATVVLIAQSINAAPTEKKPINRDTILELAPFAPTELEVKIQQAFAQKPTLAPALSGVSYSRILPGTSHAPFSMNFRSLTTNDAQLFFEPLRNNLSAAGIQVPAGQDGYSKMLQNFTIPLDNNWYIKASGLLNRRANILHEMGLNNRDPELPQAKLDEFMANHGGQTFQTLSRMTYWLRLKKCKESANLNHIGLQEKYLVHIPGRPTFAADTNYVVVAQKVQNAKPITQTTLLENPDIAAQAANAICCASLWDVNENNVVAADGKVYFIDVEQPNNCPPSNFGQSSASGNVGALKAMIKDTSSRDMVDAIASSFEQ